MVRVMVDIPYHDVQESLLFGIQELVRLRHHLLVLPYHAPCPAVPMPPPWLEVGVHLFYLLNHHNYRKVLVASFTFWLG